MRRHARGIVIGLAIAAVVVGLALAPLLLVHRSDLPLERAYGNGVVSLVSRVMAGGATNPVAGNARAASNGRVAYVGSCAACHGATGDGKGAFGQTTYPAATDLLGTDAKESPMRSCTGSRRTAFRSRRCPASAASTPTRTSGRS